MELGELMKKGRRYPGALFDIRYAPGSLFKGAVVISKKTASLSVGRHLLKRRMHVALESVKPLLTRTHVLCIVKKTATAPSVEEYIAALVEFTRKVPLKSV